MSFEDTHCPCGAKKLAGTMLCHSCVDAFAHRAELRAYTDETRPLEARRNAAIILVMLARRRTRKA